MGSKKDTTTNVTNSQTTPTATPEQTQMNQLQLQQYKDLLPQSTAMQQQGFNTGTALLSGQNLPGYLNTIPGGIDQKTQDSIVQESLRQIAPQFQQGGILNSGAAASIASRTAGDIYRNSAQFNVQNLQQLLNLAVGGQAIPQATNLANTNNLSSSLSGLRSFNTTGSGTQTQLGQNPFLNSFQSTAGTAFGNPFQSFSQAGAGYAGFTGGLA